MGPLSKEIPIRIGEKHMNEKYLKSNASIKSYLSLFILGIISVIFNKKLLIISS